LEELVSSKILIKLNSKLIGEVLGEVLGEVFYFKMFWNHNLI
jgi:hypothetical protein